MCSKLPLIPLCERPFHSMRDPASLWETMPFCERPGLSLRGTAFLWKALPFCERPGLSSGALASVRGPSFLWEALPLCERANLSFRGPTSLLEALALCEWPAPAVKNQTIPCCCKSIYSVLFLMYPNLIFLEQWFWILTMSSFWRLLPFPWNLFVALREDIQKKASFFWTLSKRGGVQPESKSFEVVLFSPRSRPLFDNVQKKGACCVIVLLCTCVLMYLFTCLLEYLCTCTFVALRFS